MQLRPYQTRIVTAAIELFLGEHRDRKGNLEPVASSVMIESPTGSGKTVMALSVARFCERNLGMTVGWCAMRRNLLAQAEHENRRWGFDVDLRLISMFDKHPPPCDLLVIDEAQHDGALSMANVYGQIKPQKLLGLSATPFRSDRFKLCFEKWIRDAGIHQLIQDGYLSRYHHYTIPLYSPQSVAETYLREPQHWGRSLIFFHRLEQCRACERILRAAGVRAETVTASTDRQRQIAQFETGEIDVLLNMIILAEGFDCPALRTVFCRPSGRLCTVQMAGRVFRKHADSPFKQLVQCQQTRHPFPRTATPDEQYLWEHNEWRSLKTNRHIDAMCAAMQKIIATSKATLPNHLKGASNDHVRLRSREFAQYFRRPHEREG